MDAAELRALQAPIKDRYKSDPSAAGVRSAPKRSWVHCDVTVAATRPTTSSKRPGDPDIRSGSLAVRFSRLLTH